MYDGLLGLHSLFRWVILIFLIINIGRGFVVAGAPYSEDDKKWSTRLMIAGHFTLLIGLFQYFFGTKGYAFIDQYGIDAVMKDSVMRFWAVEHISGMILAVILITIGRGVYKKEISDQQKHKRKTVLFLIALLLILAVIPWPFRSGFEATPWFRGLSSGV
jgi:hypothetical protein